MKNLFFVFIFSMGASAAFAETVESAHFEETAECIFWKSHLPEVIKQIQKAKWKLENCKASSLNNCDDLEILLASLQNEKAGTEQFIEDFCSY